MAIKVSGNAFQGISALGSSVPEAGFYEVSIVTLERAPTDKATTRRVHVQFENGFKMFSFLSVPFDETGAMLTDLTDKQLRGRMAVLRSILESLGYSASDIEGAAEINTNWFLTEQNGGRKAHIEFIPGQKGVQGSYNEIGKWLNPKQFAALKGASTPAPSAAAKPAVSNGAPVPSAGVSLPPPASTAQGIVS
jgi:hypothetical protein|tara:strand:+ start:5328 stop:5906 length:579 start_codon:yes stop_codon:yes gene_type:complete